MNLRLTPRFLSTLFVASLPAVTLASEIKPSHRSDFEMNFIGGSEFRDYIMKHVSGDDLWSRAMITFGNTHNLMHELMSDIARHDIQQRGNPERVPEFATRISGGQWTSYREAVEAADETPDWTSLVIATEVMHDRFHQAMYHATVLDKHISGNTATVRDYLRDDPLPEASVFPSPLLPDAPLMEPVDFVRVVWTAPPETQPWHAAYQQTAVFTEMLSSLMTEWARHAADTLPPEAHPPEFTARIDPHGWAKWINQFPKTGHDEWRNFLQSVALMDHHIREMLYWMDVHNATLAHSGKPAECCAE